MTIPLADLRFTSSSPASPDSRLFQGDGEMRALCRATNWSTTPLGPVSGWSQSLRTITATILASRHPMFLWWGPELVQIYNDAYRPSFGEGGRHPRALGMRGAEFWTEIWEIIGPQIEGVMTRGESTWHEDQLVPIIRNGRLEEVYWTYGYSPVLDDDGTIGGTLVVCQETTASVASRHALSRMNEALELERSRLFNVFRDAPGFAAVLRGPEHVFELANDAYFRVVGRRDIVGKSLREALPELANQGFIELLNDVLQTGKPFVGHEVPIQLVRIPGAPPEELFVDFVYEPLTEIDGTRSGVVAYGSDVTEHVRARRDVERLLTESEHARTMLAEREVERERLIAALEAANRAKDDFLALVSHELRSPLAGIASNVQMLDMELCGPVSERQKRALERITRSQEHLRVLIDHLLDLKQIEAGKMLYEVVPMRACDALDDAATLMESQIESRHMTLARPRHEIQGRSAVLLADPRRLRQILLNLLSNAAKFTPSGGTVTLRCRQAGDRVLLEVSDDGIGIAAHQLEEIFEPFVQVRDGRQPVISGTGLGLAISRDLARGMDGDLFVTSTVGKGSTFTVTLPAG